jgi:methyltransferase (TIGR00027 family)
MKRRIDTQTSRTAQMTCMMRAASALETKDPFKSGDDMAPLLLPGILASLLHSPLGRRLICRLIAPRGIYEYVIARTKYIDAVFEWALREEFPQILIFGAGFDTRAVRFQGMAQHTHIFELDVPVTQQAKLGQYQALHLAVPATVTFIPIDFDRESLPVKLEAAGFRKQERSLFVLEGLLMYLQPEAADATFQTIRDYAGRRSWIVFDYVYASVLRKEGTYYGEAQIERTVSGAGEQWHFGIEKGDITRFLERYDFQLVDHKDARDLEQAYFTDPQGNVLGKMNGTHCLVTAEKR